MFTTTIHNLLEWISNPVIPQDCKSCGAVDWNSRLENPNSSKT